MSPQVQAKIRSVHTLTERGATPGERAAAEAALGRLLARHGITLEQVIAPRPTPTSRVYFTYGTKADKEMLKAVAAVVLGGDTIRYYIDGRRRRLGFDLTPGQEITARRMYAEAKREYKRRMNSISTQLMREAVLHATGRA